MGMFDWFEPKKEYTCPKCETPLKKWQGKDLECDLLRWKEGERHPVNLDDPQYNKGYSITTPYFHFYSYDCKRHAPIRALGIVRDGIWKETVLLDYLGEERTPLEPII